MAVAIVCAVCSITINPGKVQAGRFLAGGAGRAVRVRDRDGGKYRHDPV